MYLDFGKWIYISLYNPFKTIKKLKGVFKPIKRKFRCGKQWYPVLWCSKPAYIQIMSRNVGWKDKDDTPRYEYPPYVWIHLFGFNLVWYWEPEFEGLDVDDYWEQALWYLYYYNTISYGSDKPDIEKAKESWPWFEYKINKSSWNNNFLIDD